MLAAVAAWRLAPTTEARSALLKAQVQHFSGQLIGHTDMVTATAVNANSRLIATGSQARHRQSVTEIAHYGPFELSDSADVPALGGALPGSRRAESSYSCGAAAEYLAADGER